MKINTTTTFMGLFVTITAKSGMEYEYIRIKPDYWIYQSGGNGLDPWFSPDELEQCYSEFLTA